MTFDDTIAQQTLKHWQETHSKKVVAKLVQIALKTTKKVEVKCGRNDRDLCSAFSINDLAEDKYIICLNNKGTRLYLIDTETFPKNIPHKDPMYFGELDYCGIKELYHYNTSEQSKLELIF